MAKTGWYCTLIEKFRGLPTPLLITAVLSRFVFGFGLGAVLAAPRKGNWKRAGWIVIGLGTALVVPAAVKVLRGEAKA